MNCQQAWQEQVLESLSEAGVTVNTPDLTIHRADCEDFRIFSETQTMLDIQLCAAISAPRLSPRLSQVFSREIRREPVFAWPAFLPDIAHVAGCLCAIVLCLWLLPLPPAR